MDTEDKLCEAVLLWMEKKADVDTCTALFQRVSLADVSSDFLESRVLPHAVTQCTPAILSKVQEEIERRQRPVTGSPGPAEGEGEEDMEGDRVRQVEMGNGEEVRGGADSGEAASETQLSEAHTTQTAIKNLTVRMLQDLPADCLLAARSYPNEFHVLVWSHSEEEWTTFARAVPSHGSSAVLHGDRLIVTGGKEMHSFDLKSHQWSRGRDLHQERSYHGMAVVRDKVYVVAGFHDSNTLSSIEEYSQDSGQWTQAPDLKFATHQCGVAALGDTILVVGGGFKKDSQQRIQTFNVIEKKPDVLGDDLPQSMNCVHAARLGNTAFFVGSEGDLVQIREVNGKFQKPTSIRLEGFGKRESFAVQVTDILVWVTDCEKKALRRAIWDLKGKKIKEGKIAELSKHIDVFAVWEVQARTPPTVQRSPASSWLLRLPASSS